MPKVTVAMPVFNGGEYLRDAVLSIIWQTYTDWELLIINDGSNDGAIQSIKRIQDKRIIIVEHEENKGLAFRLNECIDRSSGTFFARMDADDVAYPERLAEQVKFLEKNTDVDLVAVRCISINEEHHAVSVVPWGGKEHESICARPWQGFYFPHPTWLGKTEWFRSNRYTIPSPYYCEDQELMLRTYAKSRFATIPKFLFAYRLKGKVNWCKNCRSWLDFLQSQIMVFLKDRKIGQVFLAIIVFLLRLLHVSNILNKFFSDKKINSIESEKWMLLQKKLNEVKASL